MDFCVVVFNVEHGFCACVQSPSGKTLLIDCGCTSRFSPIKWLVDNKIAVSADGKYYFTEYISSHPHGDHLDDIEMLKKYPPKIIFRQSGYDWAKVTEVNSESGKKRVAVYKPWQETYSNPAPAVDWGFELYHEDYLTPAEAKALDESKLVNNSSIPVVITFRGTLFQQKFVFAGDLEIKGWQALLARSKFRAAIKNTDFFITSHHGHSSGYCKEIFDAMGTKPKINIVSAHSGDDSVDQAYTGTGNANGIGYLNGVKLDNNRYMLTTRDDGSIFIVVDSNGRYDVRTVKIPDNLKPMTLSDLFKMH